MYYLYGWEDNSRSLLDICVPSEISERLPKTPRRRRKPQLLKKHTSTWRNRWWTLTSVCEINSVFFPRRCVFLHREYLNWGCHSYLFQILETFGQLLTLVEIQGGRCKLHRRFLEDHIVLRWVFHPYCLFTLLLATLGVTSHLEYGRTYLYYDLPLATWFPRKGTHRSNNHRLPMPR